MSNHARKHDARHVRSGLKKKEKKKKKKKKEEKKEEEEQEQEEKKTVSFQVTILVSVVLA